MKTPITTCAGILVASSCSFGAVIVDGTRDPSYGPALAVQSVQTQFGDNTSEWNAAHARIESGQLYLMPDGKSGGQL